MIVFRRYKVRHFRRRADALRPLARDPPAPPPPRPPSLALRRCSNVPALSGVAPPLLSPVELRHGNDASGSSSSSSNLTAEAAVSPAFATTGGAPSGGTPAPTAGATEPPPTDADGVPMFGKQVWNERVELQGSRGTQRGYAPTEKAFISHCREQGW